MDVPSWHPGCVYRCVGDFEVSECFGSGFVVISCQDSQGRDIFCKAGAFVCAERSDVDGVPSGGVLSGAENILAAEQVVLQAFGVDSEKFKPSCAAFIAGTPEYFFSFFGGLQVFPCAFDADHPGGVPLEKHGDVFFLRLPALEGL